MIMYNCCSFQRWRRPHDMVRKLHLTFDPALASFCRVIDDRRTAATKLCSVLHLLQSLLQDGLTVAAPSCRRAVLPKQVPITAGTPARGPGRARQNESGRASERLELIRTIWTRCGPEFIPERRNVSHSWRGRRRLINRGSRNNELRGAAGGDGEREREREPGRAREGEGTWRTQRRVGCEMRGRRL